MSTISSSVNQEPGQKDNVKVLCLGKETFPHAAPSPGHLAWSKTQSCPRMSARLQPQMVSTVQWTQGNILLQHTFSTSTARGFHWSQVLFCHSPGRHLCSLSGLVVLGDSSPETGPVSRWHQHTLFETRRTCLNCCFVLRLQ